MSRTDPNDPRHARARMRAERIREQVSILQVLAAYGYHVRADAGNREQQFSCDLHGDSRDTKPSARVYPFSQSWYCFACDKTRDALETVRAKEGLDFWGALKKLEADYNLPPLPVEQGYEPPDPHKSVREALSSLDPHKTFDDDLRVITQTLEALTTPPRQLTMEKALAFWEGIDRTVLLVKGEKGEGGPMNERDGRAALRTLLDRLILESQ